MPIDVNQNIERWEAEDMRRFTLVMTPSVPSTVQHVVFNTDGNTLAPVAVQSGLTVTVSGASNVGLFYVLRQLPTSVGFYTHEWRAFGSGTAQQSLYIIVREEFEIIKTEPHSFFTYGVRADVVRRARQLVGRGDVTERDIRPMMEAGDGWIDSKLGKIITVPISPVPFSVREMANRMAVYFLYQSYYGAQKADMPSVIENQFDKDNEFLDGVVEGKWALAGSGVSFIFEQPVSVITGGTADGKPAFGRSDWEDQRIDPTILDFEDDERS